MSSPYKDLRQQSRLDVDVVVVGGGAAGLAASCTAAKQGLNVVLLERYGFCGGAAVAGMSGTICGLYLAREGAMGKPEKIIGGFVENFINAMNRRNGLTDPIRYGETYTLVHDPLVWRESADDLLEESGVNIIYHATVIGTLLDGDRIAGVTAYTKQGILEIRSKIVIDASGDADIFAMTGLETFMGQDGRVQNPTAIFRIGGVNVNRFLDFYGNDSIMPKSVTEQIIECNKSGKYKLPRTKIFLFPTPKDNELLCNCTRVIGRDGRELNPLNYVDLTEAEQEGRKQVRQYEQFFREYLPGCENAYVNETSVQVGIRQSRQIQGLEVLKNEDVLNKKKNASSIARSPWPIELHSGDKPKLVWLYEDYYDIPLECFLPIKGEGLLAAGRCLSAEHEAMASARVTAQCFSYGHAIGHAAALSINEGIAVRDLKAHDVRRQMIKEGALLDE